MGLSELKTAGEQAGPIIGWNQEAKDFSNRLNAFVQDAKAKAGKSLSLLGAGDMESYLGLGEGDLPAAVAAGVGDLKALDEINEYLKTMVAGLSATDLAV